MCLMRWSIVLLLVVSLLFFGCLEDKGYTSANNEQILNSQTVDLDGDGSYDYAVFDYSPVGAKDSGMTVQRQVTVAVQSSAAYTKVNPNLTDVDLLIADQSLDEFSKSRIQSDTACSQSIGLSNVVCSDIATCAKLCSGASLRCKKIAGVNDEALAGSMISYVKGNNEIRSLILDARRMVMGLRTSDDAKRDEYLNKTRNMIYNVADINANPLYTNNDLLLCQHSDFGADYVVNASKKIGQYSSENSLYHYRVLISVKPAGNASTSSLGMEVASVGLTDRMPKTAIPQIDLISSIQSFSASEDQTNALINWSSNKPNKEGYLFYYEFYSYEPPESALASIRSPDLRVRKVNLIFLAPTNTLLIMLNRMLNNYYIAFGGALGITLAAVLFIYNLIILAMSMLKEKAGGASFITGFRKAFGRTDVRWKSDGVLAVVLLGAGYYVSSAMAVAPANPVPLLESIDFLIRNDMGVVGISLTLVGVLLAYFAVENITKITILERAYGMVIRQEKDMFLARAASLKDRLKELETLVEEYSKQDFDVSKENDVLMLIRAEKVDMLSKEMTARSKALVDDYLSRTENALSTLKERKKIADENWPKWKESIEKMLEEQNEVYTNSLLVVPASLRSWALGRYVRESGVEGIVFERDALKKKRISPDELVRDMVGRGLLKGAIVLKQDKVVLSAFAEGTGTVRTALTLKLIAYLRTLAKSLGQHAPASFVSVGDKTVIVMMRNRMLDSMLFVGKDKFKESIELWKTKIKIFEAG